MVSMHIEDERICRAHKVSKKEDKWSHVLVEYETLDTMYTTPARMLVTHKLRRK